MTSCSRPPLGRFNFPLKSTFDGWTGAARRGQLFIKPWTLRCLYSSFTGGSQPLQAIFFISSSYQNHIHVPIRFGDLFCSGRSGFYGWMGFGGSCFQWNPHLKIGFAFVPTELEMDLTNMRAGMLQEAVVRVVTNRSTSTSTEPWWPLE